MASDADEGDDLSADDGFSEDLEALKRACFLTGTDLNNLRNSSSSCSAAVATSLVSEAEEEEDDIELVRGIQRRFSEAPLSLKPLSTLPPDTWDDDEDDFETLRAIQRRFSSYEKGDPKNSTENYRNKQEQVHAHDIDLESGSSNNFEVDTSEDPETLDKSCPDASQSEHDTETPDLALITSRPGFPKAAQMFVEAIRQNRECKKMIRNKMMQIASRIEENQKLQQRLKVLKGFQLKCKKQTSRAFSQKKDERFQLISTAKPNDNLELNGKKPSALSYGPDENSHVASYKMVLKKFPISMSRRKWSDEERNNLAKGIKQQFQVRLVQGSVDKISGMEGDSSIDDMLASIKNREITAEEMRQFLPYVNWEQLASMYIKGRSGVECEARWLNWEDQLINHNLWTTLEDKKLLYIIQQKGISNWINIAVSLGTNRTPFQCLARYQRSLNASVIKSEWTEDEDEKLRAAVATFGNSNWENVAANLVGRTGPQCSNRWLKSLHPARERTGTWSLDEDKRLKVAVLFFGPKSWKKIAHFVPGRTQVQCRERWVNNLDPLLNLGEWTEEEDLKLKSAIEEYGYCWSKVAACVSCRTDNQCLRRWKVLFPAQVPLLQAARSMRKKALPSNFVDRESERPTLGANDFIPLALRNAVSGSEEIKKSRKGSRKSRSKKAAKGAQVRPNEVSLLANGTDGKNVAVVNTNMKKKKGRRLQLKDKDASEPAKDVRDGQEVKSCNGELKKKKTARRQKMMSSEGLKEMGRVNDSRVEVDSERGREKKSCPKKRSGPANSHVSACGDSDLITTVNVEEVGEHIGDRAMAKNMSSSKSSRRKKERKKSLNEAASSFGENEAFSEVRRLSSPNVEHGGHVDSTEVNSSPCPNSAITKNKTKKLGGDGRIRKSGSTLGRIKCSKLMREVSDMTENSDAETLGSMVLKKRKLRRSLKKHLALNCVITNKVVEVTGEDERDFVSDVSTAGDNIESSVRDRSSLHGERKSFKRCVSKYGNGKLGKKVLRVDIYNHQGGRLKKSRVSEQIFNDHELGEVGDDMTIASFIKGRQKKRRLSSPPRTPPNCEIFKEGSRTPLFDIYGNREDGYDPVDTCSPPPGFENQLC